MAKTRSEKDRDAKKPAKADEKDSSKPADGGWRETVESIAMAVILALLFRGFVAEAFVIPTGSMAPTLQGRHKDVWCPKCGVQYQTGASEERDDDVPSGRHVISTTCPICRYTQQLDLFNTPNDHSFSGDRIIVGKFCYDLAEPERWDVIVFKFPGNAVQNYIKRLIGLPNETIKIVGGNVYAKQPDDEDFKIARKPPHKLNVLLQKVDDTDYIAQELIDIGWPSRWQEWSAEGKSSSAWKLEDGGRRFTTDGKQDRDAWLRYRHLIPSHDDWQAIELDQQLPSDIAERQGQLISDFYAYNADATVGQREGTERKAYLTPDVNRLENYDPSAAGPGDAPPAAKLGQHWVDDLAVECVAEVTSNQGELLLMLVRGGFKYICRINLADGKATLSVADSEGQPLGFLGDDGKSAANPTATTSVTGAGSYRLRLSNCDHELLLWVNGSVVEFDGPTTYPSHALLVPFYSAEDPGDLAPAGIGTRGAAVAISGLRIYRDKYYIAGMSGMQDEHEYSGAITIDGKSPPDYRGDAELIQRIFADPALWTKSNLFDERKRQYRQFTLDEDQFLPMGDNSPASYDGRFWAFRTPDGGAAPHNYVERDLLIGKALLIYWPHTWNRPVPYTPNFRKMGPIR